MRTRTSLSALAVASLALLCVAPALAGPRASTAPALPHGDPDIPRRGADSELPTDGRPIVATVIEVDEDEGRVMLSTAHGPVAVSVAPDIAARLSVGDIVVVRFTEEDEDAPAASPPTDRAPRGGPTMPKGNTI